MTELQSKLRGVLGFPVTPFQPDLSGVHDGLARNVARMAGHQLCAIAAGAGEFHSIDTVPVTVKLVLLAG